MSDIRTDALEYATRLRRLVEQADTPDLRETARRDLESTIKKHPGLRKAVERRFPGDRPTQF
jgi:hypothetical protein